MLNYLYANNYKSFVNFRIEFDRISLLIGKNGSGKSNVFTLIAALRNLIQGDAETLQNVFLPSTLTRWMRSDLQTFEMGISSKTDSFVYRLEVLQDVQHGKSKIFSEQVTCNGKIIFKMNDEKAKIYDDNNGVRDGLVDSRISSISFAPQDSNHTKLSQFRQQVSLILLCTPNPKEMIDVVQNDVYLPYVNFSNIASAYVGITQLDPDIYNELTNAFKEINPNFYKARVSIETFAKYLTFDYMYNDVKCSFHLNELSDGEKMLFALHMLLYGFIKNGFTVLLDEPDNYISLREIQPWCIGLENELGEEGQCLMISHHPEVIDYMADTSGIWMDRMNSGESIVKGAPTIDDNDELLTYSQMISRGLLDEAE